jgi:hypothetical protein
MAGPSLNGSFRGRASSTTTSLISLKTASNVGYCQELAPQASRHLRRQSFRPERTPGPKAGDSRDGI